MKSASMKNSLQRFGVHAALILFCVVVFFPLLWVVLVSLQPTDSGVTFVLGDMLKKGFTIANFGRVAELIPLWNNFFNTVVSSVVGTLLTLFFCSLAGFAFAKLKFKFKETIYGVLLAFNMIPVSLLLVPMFINVLKR